MAIKEQTVQRGHRPRQRSRLARAAYAVGGIVFILAGVLLLILTGSAEPPVDTLGFLVSSEIPGAIVVILGLIGLFRSGSRHSRRGDDDPESHHTLPRDLRDRDLSSGEVYFGDSSEDAGDSSSDDNSSDNDSSDDD